MLEQETDYTEILENEYGKDLFVQPLIKVYREEYGMTDEEIFHFLKSFY